MVSPPIKCDAPISRHTAACIDGLNVCQEQEFRVLYAAGMRGLKFSNTFNSVNSVLASFRFSQILSAPAEVFPFACSMPRVSMPRFFSTSSCLRGEIFADDGDNAHVGEIAGRERKVCGRAAENVLYTARRAWRWCRTQLEPTARMLMLLFSFPDIYSRINFSVSSALPPEFSPCRSGSRAPARIRTCSFAPRHGSDGFAHYIAGVLGIFLEHAR